MGQLAPLAHLHAQLVDQLAVGAAEAYGQQDEVTLKFELAAGHVHVLAPGHLLDPMGPQAPDTAMAVVEGVGLDGEDALPAFLVGQRVPQHQRPQRPGRALVALVGRPLVDVELMDRRRSLAVRGAQAVGPGVASSDDDDLLADGVDGRPGEQPGLHPVGGHEVVHGQVDAVEVPARDLEVPLPQGADGQDHGVVGRPQVLNGQVDADVDAALEDRALGLHLVDPAVQEGLVHLEVGDAVADEAAGAVVALVDDDVVPGPDTTGAIR